MARRSAQDDRSGNETSDEGIEELADGGVEQGRLIHVKDVPAVEGEEVCVGTTVGHFLEMFGSGNAALGAADQKRGARSGEKVVPVIAAETGLGSDHFAGFEGKGPAVGSLAERVNKVGSEALADFGDEGVAGRRDAGPGKDEADVVGDHGADVLNDERGDAFRMAGSELERVDATEGAAEERGLLQTEVREESFNVADVVVARVGGRVAGVAVAALIERDDAPMGRKEFGELREGGGFHQVAMECEEDARISSYMRAGVEIRECEATVREGVTLQAHGRSDGTRAEKEKNRDTKKQRIKKRTPFMRLFPLLFAALVESVEEKVDVENRGCASDWLAR